MISMIKFFSEARKVEKKDINKNKYTMVAYNKNLDNYRIMTVGDLVRNKWKPDKDVEYYVMEYIKNQGEVLLIANKLLKTIPQIQIRAFNPEDKNNRFTVKGKQASVPYGFGMMDDDFSYGDWVILVEGMSDREALIDIYPNVMAVLSDGISTVQMELIRNLTDKFLIIYDNDEVGSKGFYRDRKKLKEEGKTVKGFRYPKGSDVGDPGDILELKYRGKTFEAENIKNYFDNYINSIIS